MKQLLVAIFIILIGWIGISLIKQKQKEHVRKEKKTIITTVSPSSSPKKETNWLFVPYWSITEKPIDQTYDKIVYFGVSANENGIDTQELGYKTIDAFVRKKIAKEKYLTVRLINDSVNAKILSDQTLTHTIATQSATLAKEDGFEGIVLDFEQNALAFSSVVTSITNVYKTFYNVAREENIKLYITMYGDVVYRARPYDISKIASFTDGILIMAYDFHKANGDPGPNFPLSGKDVYGYEYRTLIDDFLKYTTVDKLTVIFGLFGYDWIIDDKNRSTTPATSLTFLEAQKKFQAQCPLAQCVQKRDSLSKETEVRYVDSQGKNHDVWYEDRESVFEKETMLKTKGFSSFAFWAYSYF